MSLENQYADDVVINETEFLEELQEKLILWKNNMEGNGLQVNNGKTNVYQKSSTIPPAPCVSMASAQTPSSVVVVPVGSSFWPSEAWSQLQV